MDGFAPSDKNGNYKRPKSLFSLEKSKQSLSYDEKLYLIIGTTCPWSHRTLILFTLMYLSKSVSVIFLEPDYKTGQWNFKEPFFKNRTLKDLYKKSKFQYLVRATAPVLVNIRNQKTNIISNESEQIVKILNTLKRDNLGKPYLVESHSSDLENLIHENINNGVYKCGFARNQNAYQESSENLFSALTKIERLLIENQGPWICGSKLNIADIYLFPTLIRWELIYSRLFKCTAKEISEYRNIMEWRFRFFNLKGISNTCYENQWTRDYYKALFPLNPNQIVPIHSSLTEIIDKSLN